MQASLTWEEKLFDATNLCEDASDIRGIFPQDYQAATDIAEAAVDINTIAALSKSAPLAIILFANSQAHKPPVLSIFSLGTTISISQATPVLENIGLEVLRAHSYTCAFRGQSSYLLKLAVRTYDGTALDPERFNAAVSPGLIEILAGRAHSDPLNSLLRRAPLNVRHIALLRAYCALLWQVQKVATKRTMWEALAAAPDVAFKLFTIFNTMFNPASGQSLSDRQALCATQSSSLLESLRKVPDITHDRVLRALFALVQNTVRTNFYTGLDTFAFKITPEKIEFMPYPRPLFEIFVFSPRIEGTHLRSARVARGGIRWSERIDDYRSEVLGLMKTQKVKNVIIVPSGAKGGFVNKQPPTDPGQIPAAVEQCYREYISALLSLADNETPSGIAHPIGCVIHDGPDPYFVVAADKGTATFSDIANGIAQNNFSFWLGDAFASGGSQGYDHKKYGITARGGWTCVERHFRDLGIDYLNAPFTVVGIGDMSGDVFGNALLLSKQASLIAAFNHKHIFIDPNPDNMAAFQERKRLFETPRSQWSDYNTNLISAGGGVFNRFDKEILLSQEARRALSISDAISAAVDGETLIRLILQASVDLLWNGGIGTYVKAHSETHSDVNDGTNDRVRINADELRARVVGEGGNLGFTQRARIEFAHRGGRINTDAIDNSGGVDLSDHEVNLKLLLNPIVAKGKITLEERNQLLKEIADQVIESVLEHNRSQALMLTIAQQRSAFMMEQYRSFIREMNRLGYLDRTRDSLPDDEEIDDRISHKHGLSRPELAYCNAAMKMYAKDELCKSTLCGDPYLEPVLLHYFPEKVQQLFTEEIRCHSLRAEIVASELVNQLIPVVDIPFIFSLAHNSGESISTVIASIVAADQILGLSAMRKRLQEFDSPTSSAAFIELWRHCCNALRQASSWLINVHGSDVTVATLVDLYKRGVEEVVANGGTGWEVEALIHPLPLTTQETARLQLYREVVPIFEVLWTAHEYHGGIPAVSSIFSNVVAATGVQFLFTLEATITPSNKWEHELIRAAYQEIRRSLSDLTGQLYKRSLQSPHEVTSALTASSGFTAMRATLQDILQRVNSKRSFEVAALPVLARQLRILSLDH
jgi:glutamate dehydrogenase